MMSAAEYEGLKRRDRRVVCAEDFNDEELALLAAAEPPAEYAYLDKELDEPTEWPGRTPRRNQKT